MEKDTKRRALLWKNCYFKQFTGEAMRIMYDGKEDEIKVLTSEPEKYFENGWNDTIFPGYGESKRWYKKNAKKIEEVGFIVYEFADGEIGLEPVGYKDDFLEDYILPLFKLREKDQKFRF